MKARTDAEMAKLLLDHFSAALPSSSTTTATANEYIEGRHGRGLCWRSLSV